jgi:TolB protein
MMNHNGQQPAVSDRSGTGSRLRGARRFLLLAACYLLPVVPAHALLTIEITKGADTGQPVAVVPFAWEGPGAPPQVVSDIVTANLARSGRFQVLPKKDYVSRPHEDKQVVFKDWRVLKAEALVIGSVRKVNGGQYQVQFRLFDVFKETQLAGYRYTVGPELLRTVAHQISDIIHEKLTGEPGAFNTRIAYITREGGRQGGQYKLQVADSDGVNPLTVGTSREPMLSPAWSPDGRRLAYVSFEDKRAKAYLQNVADGKRELLAEFKGINSAPAWSPDGTRLALTLSKDGNPEIYVLTLASRELRRLTNNPAIETEPNWSPDGKTLIFTSDRSGRPQIYRMSADGGDAERLTFEGDYNARASFSPDGKQLTLVSGNQGQYHIATLQLNGLVMQVLTDTMLDESPSFAPNGRLILYATEVRGHGVLASISSEGRTRQLYKFEQGDVREPAWSPYNRELQLAPGGAKE